MDFIVGLPRTPKGNDLIWVIVDRLTKVVHFVPLMITFGTERSANLYVEHILRLHGSPKSIVSDQGPQFVAEFCRSFHNLMGTTLSYSTAFHPQTNGQTKRVNQVLEDMLWPVHSLTAQIGRAVYHLQSSHTITFFKQVSKCHPLRAFTGGSAGPH
jgi:hypothetical protein